MFKCENRLNCHNYYMGMWHSGCASALQVECLGFDSLPLHTGFEWSRVPFTLRASIGTYSSEVENLIVDIVVSSAQFVCFIVTFAGMAVSACPLQGVSY